MKTALEGFDWKRYYRGSLDWLQTRTIFVTQHGSMAYGTNGPGSDIDVKGVAIPPRDVLHGFTDRFEQADSGWEGIDAAVYDLRKFIKLAADCNPNIIELLFVDESNWIEVDPRWRKLLEHRDLFLSQDVRPRFTGYAMAQLKRIETHRQWLLHPPKHQPTRKEFDLPEFTALPADQLMAAEDQMKKQIEAWDVDLSILDDATRIMFQNELAENLAEMKLHAETQWLAAGRKLGFDENFQEHLKKERVYRAACSRWKQYQTWLLDRNPARAELEAKYGYDTKHGMHLVRLMRMAREILAGKGVLVKRPDAEELRAIRFHGAWSYEKIITFGRAQDDELRAVAEVSPLPKKANRAALQKVCVELVESML